jgi:predicted kinase
MANLIMMIGVPGSGKSTVAAEIKRKGYYERVSTDDYIEQRAASNGKTYSEVFKQYIDAATAHADEVTLKAIRNRQNIIIDQTNLTVAARRDKLAKFHGVWNSYQKIAVHVLTPPWPILNNRLAARSGKDIPADVINSMATRLELPDFEEGFDEVRFYDSITNKTYYVKGNNDD